MTELIVEGLRKWVSFTRKSRGMNRAQNEDDSFQHLLRVDPLRRAMKPIYAFYCHTMGVSPTFLNSKPQDFILSHTYGQER